VWHLTREKGFSNLSKQIQIQEERNLQINDHEIAKKNFLEKNYFNLINGFESVMLKDYTNKPLGYENKSITDFYSMQKLDAAISKEIFGEISKIETELKSKISYYFCEMYCTPHHNSNLEYLNIANYSIPTASDGNPKYTGNFYNTWSNGDINPKRTHTLFKKHRIRVTTNNLRFTGRIVRDPNHNNFTLLKGVFRGSFKGLTNNIYRGTLSLSHINYSSLTQYHNTNQNNLRISNNNSMTGYLCDLSYSDYCKIKFPYISNYDFPPFWVIIDTLMLNDLLILYFGLPLNIKQNIVDDIGKFPDPSTRMEEFVNLFEILIDLRNIIAHYGLVTRYRTPHKINILPSLKNRYNLNPTTIDTEIRFFDVLKILNIFNNFSCKQTKSLLKSYIHKNKNLNKTQINENFLKRIGITNEKHNFNELG